MEHGRRTGLGQNQDLSPGLLKATCHTSWASHTHSTLHIETQGMESKKCLPLALCSLLHLPSPRCPGGQCAQRVLSLHCLPFQETQGSWPWVGVRSAADFSVLLPGWRGPGKGERGQWR